MTGSIHGSVLVTGGGGYIGSHAVLALLDAGVPTIVLDDLSTGHRWAVDDRARFVEGSISDERLVRELLTDGDVRSIMHFAGSVVVPESVADPVKYYRNNVCGSVSLLNAALAAGVRHFVFSSTAAVYGNPRDPLVRETDPTAPINPYGRSKLMTESMLADAAAALPINVAVLRYFNVAGADPEGRAGQSTVGATHLIKAAVEAAVGKRQSVSIFGTDFDTPDGTGVRDYIHVSDLADAHVLALAELQAKPAESITLNCGYGRGYSVLQVIDAVSRATGKRIERRTEARRAGDPAALVADTSCIRARLAWAPRFDDLDAMVSHALAWERMLQTSQAKRSEKAGAGD